MTGRLEDVEPGPGRAYEAVTLSGLPVVVAVSPTGVAVNGQAAVLRTASACNGVIAVIDEVLIPLAAADDGGDPEPEYGFDYEDFDYQFPFPVPDDGGGGGQVPADADCAPSDCCDVPPPPDAVTGVQYSCAEQVGFGKCGEAFMQGFCRLSVRDRPAAPPPSDRSGLTMRVPPPVRPLPRGAAPRPGRRRPGRRVQPAVVQPGVPGPPAGPACRRAVEMWIVSPRYIFH